MANEKVDVVIVGAGASGSTYAAVLAKAGKKVVLLESGPDWQLSDLISSDMWGRRVKPAGAPFVLEGKNPYGYAYQAGWGVGGAALHYFANFPRLLPNDFKIKSEHGRALDWPISYQDVAPYYDRVADDVGVSGDAKAEEVWRPAGKPYPMPPMKTFRNGQVWLKGFEANGIRTVPNPVGMNSTEYKGRPACLYDGWCHVGCPTGAMSNPLVTYLADAKKAGAEVRARSTVTRVLTNPQGDHVTGVEYYDARKERQTQEASVVILAAWSGHNPRLMLNSTTDKHPKGLANASGLLGKYMMAHFASGTFAMFDEDVENHMGTTGAQYMSYDRYDKNSHKGAFGSTYISAGNAQKTSDLSGFANARLDLFGPALADFMKRAARGLTRIGAFGEEMPNIENRIELVSDKDEFGMPLAKIVHSYDQDAVALWNANFEEGLRVAKATGAKEVWSARGNMPTIHLFGGTIMGTDAGNSVVNSFGQTHEIANLYVAGPGIFPTEGASNPTYTIFALSLRGAENLAANWGSVAG
ncbi:MAG TPA: GMC family oxidoreductase [Xanthobacteraceae bacterium]|jgi:choline dehydrogenase-like flavoprotein|nr:GMC family oxidoreductase [Xanthobacteraceae bacterium]